MLKNYLKKINWLFVFHVITHLSIVPMILYGTLNHYLIAFFIYFVTGCWGMSATYHRLLSHKSYDPPNWFMYLGTLFGTVGGTGSSIAWCAVHREHHRFTDTEKDPHSPNHRSIWHIQFLSMLHKPNIKYVPDLLRSKFHIFTHQYYWIIHLIYATTCFFIDPFAVVYAYLFPSLILWHAGSSINTFSHIFGYQSHKTNDSSTNHWLPGILVWGEGWHNNHHADPKNFKFGKSFKEFDLTAYLISLISKSK